MSERDDSVFPVVRAADLADVAPETRWLIEPLWARAGVGILGGAPKCCKSWLALDVALSVASRTPALDRFAVHDPGDVLLYMAEDGSDIVKHRLACLARHRGVDLAKIPIDVITAPSMRLDTDGHRDRLVRTVARYRPRLLLLDPFVRLHRSIHENDAGEVSALLAYLRDLQREHDVAVLVVHHANKNGTNGASAGHGLRGSGDFFAWADSLLYMQRCREGLRLSVEHRAAAAPDPCVVHLDVDANDRAHLAIVDAPSSATPDASSTEPTLADAVLAALDAAPAPLTRNELRVRLRVRNERLGAVLTEMLAARLVTRDGERWAPRVVPVPPSP